MDIQNLKIQLIDVNGMGYAAMYQPALAKLSHNNKPTGAIFGGPNSVFAAIRKNPDYLPVVIWDGKSQWRHDVYPDYKSNRGDDPAKVEIREKYKAQVPHIKSILKAAGIPQIHHPGVEADDIAGIIIRSLPKSAHIRALTKDTDWIQALCENMDWVSITNGSVVTLDDLHNGTMSPTDLKGISFTDPQQYLIAKALSGDTSDCIEGIPGVGLKTAVKYLNQYGSVEEIWNAYDEGKTLKGETLLKIAGPDYRETFKRNLRLMDWQQADPFDGHEMKIQYTPADMDLMEQLCMTYGIKEFPGGIPEFGDCTVLLSVIKAFVINHGLVGQSNENKGFKL